MKARQVKALRKGTCMLKAGAPAIPGYLRYLGGAKIKVK